LVRAWRESPTPAHRVAVTAYSGAHPNDDLALLALGIGSYEQKDYPAAIAALSKLQGKLPKLADYTTYYLAAARVESNDDDKITATAPGIWSPLGGKARLVEARALEKSDPAQAVRVLREHYSELPQPDGDITLADCYQSAKDLNHAADFYQRVYYQYISGDAATRAAAALLTLKDAMGAAYPAPLPEQMLRRGGKLLDARAYSQARAEFQSLADQLAGVPRDQARVRIGAVDYQAGSATAANAYLRGLEVLPGEADAERLYYLVECARRQNDDEGMMATVRLLNKSYAKSPWRLKALVSAANRFLLVNKPDEFVPLYQAAYEDFPTEPAAALYHWKVTFQAFLRDKKDAAEKLKEHLRNYPLHPTAGAALYFLGRQSERTGDLGFARACYQRLTEVYQNHYYAMLARTRLEQPEIRGAEVPPAAVKLLAEVRMPPSNPVPSTTTPETAARIERSRLLRSAGLNDLADAELRFGARTDGQPTLLGLELATESDAPHTGMHIMKGMAPGYLELNLEEAPRKFWETLFPLPYKSDLINSARARDLDPYLIAGLIRQESEFNPEAVSPAKAYGLTQVRPVTGRQFARQAGVPRFSTRSLFQPSINLRIGCSIFKSMLDHHGGRLEETLAAYNAGPNRAADWLAWNEYREPAEFVESIPFTETRDYVQAVLRNADIYRRLYR
jgi:soluble lytic murein transglycosylase